MSMRTYFHSQPYSIDERRTDANIIFMSGFRKILRGETNVGLALVTEAVRRGADINEPVDGSFALHWFIHRNKSHDVIREFLKAGADPLLKDVNGNNAFFYAHSVGIWELLQNFCQGDFASSLKEKNNERATLLSHVLITWNFPDEKRKAIAYLIHNGVEIDPFLLHFVIEHGGGCEAVQILLELRCLPNRCNNSGDSSLTIALKRGRPAVCELLIKNGAKFESKEWNALITRLPERDYDKQCKDLAQYILNHFSEFQLERFGWNPIHFAARCGLHSSLLDFLHLENANAVLNQRCPENGNTPMHLAVIHNHPLCVFLLLETGQVDLSVRNAWDYEPIQVACLPLETILKIYKNTADPLTLRKMVWSWASEALTGLERQRYTLRFRSDLCHAEYIEQQISQYARIKSFMSPKLPARL